MKGDNDDKVDCDVTTVVGYHTVCQINSIEL